MGEGRWRWASGEPARGGPRLGGVRLGDRPAPQPPWAPGSSVCPTAPWACSNEGGEKHPSGTRPMAQTEGQATAAQSGTFAIGGDLEVNRLGFGAMRITGEGIWGEPDDPAECRRALQGAVGAGGNF